MEQIIIEINFIDLKFFTFPVTPNCLKCTSISVLKMFLNF
jgi:hypothetical protein